MLSYFGLFAWFLWACSFAVSLDEIMSSHEFGIHEAA
jgi:hypothetical protein